MDELHKWSYSGHHRYHKMMTMMRKDLFWPKMKKEVAEYLLMLHWMPTGKIRTPTSIKIIAAITHSRKEIGSNEHGFDNRFT